MDAVLIVRCPDCEATLTIDRESGHILAHEPAPPKRKVSSFEEAAQELSRQKERAENLFAATVEREKHKSEILEKTFRQALEKAQKDSSKPRGIFDDE